ncbi:YlxR family protein [Tissierella carlieri]|uniref:RNase P modulator RnpM n=1 Tax=Tissierella TaxID=41273 RepID=UPI000BA03CF1|nr:MULTISPECIES: YlxR family protein [Tissierella]MBU5314268.1 YlxR family protein [Tissierella carlieri]MDU5079920.1 YlxR family protein [Bacillota bacterium]OZV12941.1 nucleic acid-binding protein [Tissierella sp. P1]
MKKKKIPLRKCIACGEGKPKKELIRVVRNNEKEVSIDITGKMNGRGAYICSNLECLELAQKGKKLSRTLEVEVPNDVYESLKDIIQSKLGK